MSYSKPFLSPAQSRREYSLEPDGASLYATSYGEDVSYELQRLHSGSSRLLGKHISLENSDNGIDTIPPSKSFARSGRGIWKNQMLVDRSLWSMAILTSILGILALILVLACLPSFIKRKNTHTTSVYGKVESCRSASTKISIIHLLINIAATMVLGMSNTYQQLVTALDVEDIPHMLQNDGDSKVGTNSPWSINRKSKGKWKAWLSWLLLITTSFPIHLVANSVIGLSSALGPAIVRYREPTPPIGRLSEDFQCWTAFRTGYPGWTSRRPSALYNQPSTEKIELSAIAVDWNGYYMDVVYDNSVCGQLRNSTTDVRQLISEFNGTVQKSGNCVNGLHVSCSYSGDNSTSHCSISVRMQAAFTLAVALLLKALYMLGWNLRRRNKLKTECLTFGDVVAAATFNPVVQVPNECLVNSSEFFRKRVEHSCHKHCKSEFLSSSGDEIGHCQTCKQHNFVNKAAGLDHPIVATKYKKSLISNLGFTAVTQMIILMFCLLCMLGVSLFIAIMTGVTQQDRKSYCSRHYLSTSDFDICMEGYWKSISGGWGGFNSSVPLASLTENRISSETSAFAISNGAQLVYSLLYLLLIYNLTLISMENDWGKFETARRKIRSTIYKGRGFSDSYLLQLPKKLLFPLMTFSAMMHWLLGQAIATKEVLRYSSNYERLGIRGYIETSQYIVVWAAYPVWLSTVLMFAMTTICWWAFSYSREGYMPQMYGSIRVCCASTTKLYSLPNEGVQWGDLGGKGRFRHAGFSDSEVGQMVPGELYCGGSDRDSTATASET